MAKQVQTLGKITKGCVFGQQPHQARRKESAHRIKASPVQAGSWGTQADIVLKTEGQLRPSAEPQRPFRTRC